QQYAHMKIRFDDPAQANKAIRDGVFVQGKIVSVWKDEQEPPMCYRCHNVGDGHFAASCTVEIELCGHCSEKHWSRDCPNPGAKWCHKCKKAGHRVGDRTCESRRQALEMMRRADPEARQRYFMERDNPETWGNPPAWERRGKRGRQWERGKLAGALPAR
ncbi:hypothetical protein PLEOSDRAFT_30016, partial [Pleurotus ostreatus PC15]